MELARAQEETLAEAARLLKCPSVEVPRRIRKLLEELQKAKSQKGPGPAPGAPIPERMIGTERLVLHHLPGTSAEELRNLMDDLILRRKVAAAILAGGEEKPVFIIGVREDLTKSRGLKAGDLAREVGKACGGGGGGREIQAQAGAADVSRIPQGFEIFERLVRARLEEGSPSSRGS